MFVIQSINLEIILRAVCIVSAGLMNTPVIQRYMVVQYVHAKLSRLECTGSVPTPQEVTQPPLLVMLSTSLVAEA